MPQKQNYLFVFKKRTDKSLHIRLTCFKKRTIIYNVSKMNNIMRSKKAQVEVFSYDGYAVRRKQMASQMGEE